MHEPPAAPGALARAFSRIEAAIEAVALTAFLAMMLITLLQVLARYVLRLPMTWTEELARILFVSAMMIGIALAARRREHVVVDFLYLRLGARAQAGLQLAFGVAILLFLAVWLRGALRMIDVNQAAAFVTLPWLRVADVYRVEAVGIALTMIYVVLDLGRAARRLRGAP